MGKWTMRARPYGAKAKGSLSRKSFPSDSAWRYALLRRALDLLRRRGFKLYFNRQNSRLAVRRFGCMFEFREITPPKAQEFLAWVSSKESGTLSPLPIDIERIQAPKMPRARPVVRSTSFESSVPTTTATNRPSMVSQSSSSSPFVRGSGRRAFGYSTVPGHYAELDWNDLCTR